MIHDRMASIYVGYALLAAGLLLMFITFLLGYGLYQTVVANSNAPAATSSSSYSGNSITQVVGSVLSNATSPLSSDMYTIISVIILFLFVDIGYKIAMLGVHMVSASEEREKKDK